MEFWLNLCPKNQILRIGRVINTHYKHKAPKFTLGKLNFLNLLFEVLIGNF